VKSKQRIGELLLRGGLITEAQLSEALALQSQSGGKTVANLISLQHIGRAEFVEFLSRQPGMASISLAIIDIVPAAFALEHEILPIGKMGSELTVVMACPLDERSIV
jgi:hypothetical protein